MAFQLGGRARWLVPSTFVAAMALGAALGRSGVTVPGIEQAVVKTALSHTAGSIIPPVRARRRHSSPTSHAGGIDRDCGMGESVTGC